jgi:hypothetical protein
MGITRSSGPHLENIHSLNLPAVQLGAVPTVPLNVPTLSTTIAFIPPITCFAIPGPVAIIATVVAASSSWRWATSKIHPSTSWTTRAPSSKLHNQTIPIKIFAIQVMSCVISIPRITEFLQPTKTLGIQEIMKFHPFSTNKKRNTTLHSHRALHTQPARWKQHECKSIKRCKQVCFCCSRI